MAEPAAAAAAAVPPAEEEAAPPEPYELILGGQIVEHTDALTEDASIQQILHWIGFRAEASRENLRVESLGSFDEMKSLTEKDVQAISTDWSSRTATRRIFIGTRRLKLLQALVHWVKDFQRISSMPSIVGLNQNSFKSQLSCALERATIRKTLKEQSKTAAEAASPGPLESERKWKVWEEKFTNYLRAQIGANGIPLSYVIREEETPETGTTYPDFISETIARAPLNGEFYEADRMAVFNALISFTTDQPSGDWIKNTTKHNDGRRSMKALRNHFAGEGNASRNVAEADRLKENLHYKSERAMTFENFLTSSQKMYNIFEKEEEPMTEDAKIRFLFKRVQHQGLQPAIEALKVKQSTSEGLTYTQAANHLATAVSELPDYIAKNRNISSASTSDPSKTGDPAIYNEDGTINTGHIPSWRTLTPADRALVHAERKRLGLSKNKTSAGNASNNSAKNQRSAATNRAKQLADTNKKLKRQIKAMKRSSTQTGGGDDDPDSDNTDAGDQFGGKAAKKKQKK